ncbi:MAG: serine/threonine-protein kinase [Verrucomicrobia bacterium]|nr:serine/threonine-protein kinase [Verrucomicrobiota bacterium]
MSQEIHIPGFELLDKIGKGGRGTVYRAHQLSLDRLVAVKILGPTLATDAEYTANFLQEARAVAKLSHPNIVQAIEAGNHEGVWFFVMELVEGGSLLERLERTGPMLEPEAIEVAVQVAQALDFAWSQAGLIHRDIKPANILVTPHGQAKLADLGLAIRHGSQKEARGYIEGTPQYCAPEQCRGEPNLDTRTDLYALGATLYHLVCGRPPFDGDDPAKVMTLQITHPVEPPRFLNPNLSPEFEALILKLLAKDPADRFQSPTELMETIQQMRAPQPKPQPEPQPTATPLVPVAVATLAPRRTWLRLERAALVVGGVTLAAAAVVVLHPEWVRSQWGTASKAQGAFHQMADTVTRLTRIRPLPDKTAAPPSPTVQHLPATNVVPAASTQTASAPSQETMLQRVLNVFPRIRFTPPSATSPTLQAPHTNAISRLVATLTTARSRSLQQLVAPQKIPAPPPAPAASALLVAQLTPSPAAPAAPPPAPAATPTPPAQPAPPVQAAPATAPTPAPQPVTPKTTTVQPTPAPSAPSPAPPAVQPPATNLVLASLKAPDATSTSAEKQTVLQRAKLTPMPLLPEITFRNVPISMMVQRFFKRKQTAVDAAPIPIYGDGRNYYLETISLRITLQNLSPQTLTNVTVRWVIAKRPVTRDLTAKNVFLGAEEKLVFKPIEQRIIETTPIEVGGVMSWFVGRASGEMIRGHGIQVMIGTNCVIEERSPSNLKISFTRYQPVPKPAP